MKSHHSPKEESRQEACGEAGHAADGVNAERVRLNRLSADVLQSLCGDQIRESVSRPFSFKIGKVWWNAATDGHGLIAEMAPGGSGDYRREFAPPAADLFRNTKPNYVADFGALVKWINDCERETPCQSCGGSGVHSCNCEYCEIEAGSVCLGCDGEKVSRIRIPVDFEHLQFDRVLAARFLSPFSEITGDVPVLIGGELDQIEFRGDTWRVLLMPMKRSEKEPATCSLPEGLIRSAS